MKNTHLHLVRKVLIEKIPQKKIENYFSHLRTTSLFNDPEDFL